MQDTDAKFKELSDAMAEFLDLYAYSGDTVYRDYGNGDPVTMTQVHMLGTIEEKHGITATELSRLKRRKKSSISQVLSVLTEKGYIQRIVDERDSKKFCLYVTEKGHELCKLHCQYDIDSMAKTYQKLQLHCSEEELDHFSKVLRAYIQIRKEQLGLQ